MKDLALEFNFNNVTEQDKENWANASESLEKSLDNFKGDDRAAKRLLSKGIPIYLAYDDTPDGCLVKQYPNGKRDLVIFNESGDTILRHLP
jgi:hypothetical protein